MNDTTWNAIEQLFNFLEGSNIFPSFDSFSRRTKTSSDCFCVALVDHIGERKKRVKGKDDRHVINKAHWSAFTNAAREERREEIDSFSLKMTIAQAELRRSVFNETFSMSFC